MLGAELAIDVQGQRRLPERVGIELRTRLTVAIGAPTSIYFFLDRYVSGSGSNCTDGGPRYDAMLAQANSTLIP